MIREIADVQSVVDDLYELVSAGQVLGVVVLVHRVDGQFDSIWTRSIEDRSLVTMIGEIEFVKRDMMKKVYGS